jgi:hypothetical protein
MRETEDGLVDITVLGSVEDQDRKAIIAELLAHVRETGKVRVLIDAVGALTPRPPDFWRDAAAGFRMLRNVERVAIVGDQPWHTALAEEPERPDEDNVRFFESGTRQQAVSWLREAGQRVSGREVIAHECP